MQLMGVYNSQNNTQVAPSAQTYNGHLDGGDPGQPFLAGGHT